MSNVKPTRVRLTMDEVRAIEALWKDTPFYPEIRKLTKHIRLTEQILLMAQARAMPCPACTGIGNIHQNCVMR